MVFYRSLNGGEQFAIGNPSGFLFHFPGVPVDVSQSSLNGDESPTHLIVY